MNTEGIVSFFRDKGVHLVLEEGLKYFPETQTSRDVLDALMKDLDDKKINYRQHVIHIKKISDGYEVQTKTQTFQAHRVVLAVGSKSFPQTGSNGEGLLFAQQLDLPFISFSPAETHIYLKNPMTTFQGLSLKNAQVLIKGTKKRYTGDLLFTHFGLSGPVIYHASEELYHMSLKQSLTLEISLTSHTLEEIDHMFHEGKAKQHSVLFLLQHFIQKRIAQYIM
ncbi:MAG: hypothetical protein EOM23_12005, partial [Candidatus Moranbacteria bacterium]|nr:hypothetical protein [Candidatus Moranbacteria bacterium]